jgi:uncharacterized protein
MRLKALCEERKPRVLLIHGWDGSPSDGWFPWLREKLSGRYEVSAPELPDSAEPSIKAWMEKLGEVGEVDYIVGHSLGCNAALRFVGTGEVKGMLLVAPWIWLNEGEVDDYPFIKEWTESIPWEAVKRNVTAIFSKDDPDVPCTENAELFDEKGCHIVKVDGCGHFDEKKYDVILREFEKLSEQR